MLRYLALGASVFAIALAAGCLSVPNAADSSGTSTSGSTGMSTASGSTGATCPAGSRGCPCYGNSTCDADLVCLDDIACFPEDCVAGTELCPCLGGGGCDIGLSCQAGACKPEETGTTDGPTTGAMSTSGSGPTGGPPDVCDPTGEDAPCVACAKSGCCDEFTACAEEEGDRCMSMLDCIEGGEGYGICASQWGVEAGSTFDTLANCFAQNPEPNCQSCAPPSLLCLGGETTGGGVSEAGQASYRPCTECAAAQCCPELAACMDDARCTCLEDCFSGNGNGTDQDMCAELCIGTPDSTQYQALSDCISGSASCSGPGMGFLICYPPA